jgi:putative transposase
VEPITGKPYKPTTQGKNERFHQTLFRYLDKQPIASTLEQLQSQLVRERLDHTLGITRRVIIGSLPRPTMSDALPRVHVRRALPG